MNKTPQQEDPLFRSAKGALLFALNYTHGGMKNPALNAMMGASKGGKGRGLGGLDGAGQAGMIQVEIGRMSDLRRAIIVARYATLSTPCDCRTRCCRGWIENPEWSEPINWLTEYVLTAALTGTISHYRFRRSLVARHFGVRETFVVMSAQCGVDRHTAGQAYKKIHEHLKDEEKKAHWEIKGILEGAGVVGS